MIIDNLTSLPSTITTGDELPVERGTTTYKIDYNALAAAILAHALPNDDIVSTARGSVEKNQSVDITVGSTGVCLIFIQRNNSGGAIYGVNGNVLTPYITVSGVTATLESNNTVLRISNTTNTVTYLLLRIGII